MGSFTPYETKTLNYFITMTKPIFLTGAYYNNSADSMVLLQIREFITNGNSVKIKNCTNSTISEGYVHFKDY